MVKVKKINFICRRKFKRYVRQGRLIRLPFGVDQFGYDENRYVSGILKENVTLYISFGELYLSEDFGDTTLRIIKYERPSKFFQQCVEKLRHNTGKLEPEKDGISWYVAFALYPSKEALAKVKIKI